MTRSFASRLAAAMLCVATATGAMAEDFAADHLAAARAAIQAAHATDSYDDVLIAIAQQAKSNFTRLNPAIAGKIDETVNKVALEMVARRPELDRQIDEIWARRFTKEELAEIARFYSSPLGQKLGKESRTMLQISTAAVGVWRNKIANDLVTRVREEMKKQGVIL